MFHRINSHSPIRDQASSAVAWSASIAILLFASCSLTESEFAAAEAATETTANSTTPSSTESQPGRSEASSDSSNDTRSEQLAPNVPCSGPDCTETSVSRLDSNSDNQSSQGAQQPSCSDGSTNGTESDTDCGEDCPTRCDAGLECERDSDCESNVCSNALCSAATCEDRVRNQDETDVDCGGTCAGCGNQENCQVAGDCAAGLSCLVDPQVCSPASCEDSQFNGQESDTDCGGPCAGCEPDQQCTVSEDCTSGNCSQAQPDELGECLAASCDDNILNQSETGVDCGGTCDERCGFLQGCSVDQDCTEGVCAANACPADLGTCCQAPTCLDGLQNGDEASVDCGGLLSGCAPCATGEFCTLDSECESNRCEVVCVAVNLCTDGLLSPTETDVDCGGNCSPCTAAQTCLVDTDCSTNACENGSCCGDAGAQCIRCAERRAVGVAQCTDLANSGDLFNCQNLLACLIGNPAVCTSLDAPGCTNGFPAACDANFFGGIGGVAVVKARQIVTAAVCLP